MLKKVLSAVFCCALALQLTGCALLFGAAAGGAGAAYWLSGKLSDEVSASSQRTVDAAKQALDSLSMEVKKETATQDVTQLISEYSDGRMVWIDIRPQAETTTKIEIRVGAKGDKNASQKILDAVKRRL